MEIIQQFTVLGKFHAFLRWKGHIYRQLFYVTNANASPNLLSQYRCYTLGVLKPCYSVETTNSTKFQGEYPSDTHTAYSSLGSVTDAW